MFNCSDHLEVYDTVHWARNQVQVSSELAAEEKPWEVVDAVGQSSQVHG